MAAAGRAQSEAGRSIAITRSSMMKHPVVLIGVGEMGGVFGRGLLKLGHPVFPVIPSMPAWAAVHRHVWRARSAMAMRLGWSCR